MSKVTVPLINVTIRRDANTITPVTVAPYELTILRNMFGKENVQEGDEAGTVDIDKSSEFERLCAKYGTDKVVKVYGDDEGERLGELVDKHAVKAEKKAAPAAKSGGKKAAPADGSDADQSGNEGGNKDQEGQETV